MSTLFITLFKNLGGYVLGKLIKPEHTVEFILDMTEIVAARTDTSVDDEAVKAIRKALGHEED